MSTSVPSSTPASTPAAPAAPANVQESAKMVSKGPFFPKRITRQLMEVLSKYFPEHAALSSIYWPRCFRDFIIAVVSDIGKDLKDKPPGFNMEQCVEMMRLPTSHYIPVGYRRTIRKFLQAALVYASETPAYTGFKPMGHDCNPVTVWPADIIHVDDLILQVGDDSLRSDITEYIFYVQDQMSVQLCIDFNIKADMPIVIQAPSDEEAVRVHKFLEAVGESLGEQANLAPLDVIDVRTCVGLLDMLRAGDDEAYHSSGTPIKKGTIGAIVESAAGVKYGVSAAHVMQGVTPGPIASQFDGSEAGKQRFLEQFPTMNKIDQPEADVALFEFKDADHIAANCVNFTLLTPDHHANVGDVVYKIGARTGFTAGKLASLRTTWRDMCTGKRYVNVVAVDWDGGEQFATGGDCGAVYYIKRGPVYPVLAIHRNSGGPKSYGTRFELAMELLNLGEFRFVNSDSLWGP